MSNLSFLYSFFNMLNNNEGLDINGILDKVCDYVKNQYNLVVLYSDKNMNIFNVLYKNKKNIDTDEFLLLKRHLLKKTIIENKYIVDNNTLIYPCNTTVKNYYIILSNKNIESDMLDEDENNKKNKEESSFNKKLEEKVLSLIEVIKFILNYFDMKTYLQNHLMIDPLTGVYNFNYYQKILLTEMAKIDRIKEKLSFVVIIIDINDMEKLNETYGFLFGDEILKYVANMLKTKIRKTDELFRLGNDEFAIIASYTNKEVLKETLLKRIETEINNKTFIIQNNKIKIKLNYIIGEYNKEVDKQEFMRNLTKAVIEKTNIGNIEYIG